MCRDVIIIRKDNISLEEPGGTLVRGSIDMYNSTQKTVILMLELCSWTELVKRWKIRGYHLKIILM